MKTKRIKGIIRSWKTIAILFSASLLLSSCNENKDDQSNRGEEQAIAVTTLKPKHSEGGYFSASGRTRAAETARLSTRNMGTILSINADVGDRVTKGQNLISIQSVDLHAQRSGAESMIQEARTALNAIQTDFDRIQSLYERQSATRKELDDMTAQLEMAKARLETAKSQKAQVDAQFSYVDIVAPFSGIITERMAEPGEMAAPGQALLTLENQTSFEIWAMVPESDVTKIMTNEMVKVEISSAEKPLKGNIKSISPTTADQSGQFQVKIDLEPHSFDLMAGMYSRVLFPQNNPSDNILIPTSALIHQGDLRGVYTVSEDERAILRWLRLGRIHNDYVEVLAGLNADEKIVADFEGKLYNGAKVSINH